MKNETFRKVFINGNPENLPMVEGRYFVYVKEDGMDSFYWTNESDNEYWLNTFDWYLQPIPLSTETRTAEEILEFYKNHFRIINNWNITLNAHPKMKYTNRVNWNNKTKEANIFPCTKEIFFDDYIFHEVLHICQAELSRGSIKEKREKEEMFVVDLCRLFAAQSQKGVTLPDDEEIDNEFSLKQADRVFVNDALINRRIGAKWLREKIKSQLK